MERLKTLTLNRITGKHEINGKPIDTCSRLEIDLGDKEIRVTCTHDEDPAIRTYACDSFGDKCDIEILIKNKDFTDPEF